MEMKSQKALPSCGAGECGTDCREVIGYARSFCGPASCHMQELMIEDYCRRKQMTCSGIYCDYGGHDRTGNEWTRAEKIGISSSRWLTTFPAWEEMLLHILDGKVRCLLVESLFRLMSSKEQNEAFMRICREQKVEVIEVMPDTDGNPGNNRVGIYHFTDGSETRPRVVCSEVDRLYELIGEKGWGIPALFLDKSLRKDRRGRYRDFLLQVEASPFDIILVHSFYHLEAKVSAFWKVVQSLSSRGTRVVSKMEGEIMALPEGVLERELNVAVYDRCRSEAECEYMGLFQERARLFTYYKAPRWNIRGVYVDSSEMEETALERLKGEADMYDLVLVDMLGKVSSRTNRFMKAWKEIDRPFYSLKEGGVYYKEESSLL